MDRSERLPQPGTRQSLFAFWGSQGGTEQGERNQILLQLDCTSTLKLAISSSYISVTLRLRERNCPEANACCRWVRASPCSSFWLSRRHDQRAKARINAWIPVRQVSQDIINLRTLPDLQHFPGINPANATVGNKSSCLNFVNRLSVPPRGRLPLTRVILLRLNHVTFRSPIPVTAR